MPKKKEKHTLKSTVVYDPIAKRFIQKGHIVHTEKVLQYQLASCKECYKEFPKKRKDQEFCSTLCRMKWHSRKRRGGREPNLSPRICPICGEVFTPTREWSLYDREECRSESRRKKLAESRQAILSKAV